MKKTLFLSLAIWAIFLFVPKDAVFAVEWSGDEYEEYNSISEVCNAQAKAMISFDDEIRVACRLPSGEKRTVDQLTKYITGQDVIDTTILYDQMITVSSYCSKPGKWLIVNRTKETTEKAKAEETRIRKSEEIIKKTVSDITSPGEGDEDTVRIIYRWITENVQYDKTLKYESPTDAVLSGKAICWGYATLFHRMCYEAGVDSKYMESSTHSYNIVKVNGRWWYCDPTFDAGDTEWENFLCGEKSFLGKEHKTLPSYGIEQYHIRKTDFVNDADSLGR